MEQRFRGAITTAAAALALLATAYAHASDFTGTPTLLKTDAGWCWFQDPRAVMTNGQVIFGSIAGTAGTGISAGDANVTSFNYNTGTTSSFLLHSALAQDDHAAPALCVLPSGRILCTYENHGGTNNVLWRVSTNAGDATTWGAEQTSVVNTTNDGNGNTYNNPYYLSVDSTVYDFSRAIGYDPNYSKFTNLSNTTPTYAYGGHYMYWKNPNTGTLTGGNGRPYVKYASNNTDTIWFASTEDSPDNYDNSLYVGYMKFNASGTGTVYTSTGTSLGGISTGTAPTVSQANAGAFASGTGFSYNPQQFTPVLQANSATNNMTGKAVSWASDMTLDSSGHPYIGICVRDNLNDAANQDLEYYFARFDGSSWKVSEVGYAGKPLYSGQPNYAGLIAVDRYDTNKIYFSADVNPTSNVALLGPDGVQHYQIFEGTSADSGTTWTFSQLTNTSSDNIRPIVSGDGSHEALLWMQGSYTSYTSYSMNVVGSVEAVPEPTTMFLCAIPLVCLTSRRHRRRERLACRQG